jgi:hypothetical protein
MKVNFFLTVFLLLGMGNVYPQGVGNHATMSLENCTQTSCCCIEFDLFIVSDGDNSSHVVPNTLRYGININSSALQSGAVLCGSYLGSSDIEPPLNAFAPFNTLAPYYIEFAQPIYAGGNMNPLVVGHKYKAGRFELCSYTPSCVNNSILVPWVTNSNLNLTLQDTFVSPNKQACATLCGPGGTFSGTFIVDGTGDGQRSLSVSNCNIILNPTTSVEELSATNNIKLSPNPLTSSSILQFNTLLNNAEVIIYDVLGKEMMRKKLTGDRMEIERGGLESGVYFVRVRDGERQWVEKMAVE